MLVSGSWSPRHKGIADLNCSLALGRGSRARQVDSSGKWRHHQHLLRRRRLCDCPGSRGRTISAGLAGCQWKLRTPATRARFVKLFLGIFRFVFGCRHHHLSRVFAIKHCTYRVCFDCGRDFELPDVHAPERFAVGDSSRQTPVNTGKLVPGLFERKT